MVKLLALILKISPDATDLEESKAPTKSMLPLVDASAKNTCVIV